jgi:hypothetical protein
MWWKSAKIHHRHHISVPARSDLPRTCAIRPDPGHLAWGLRGRNVMTSFRAVALVVAVSIPGAACSNTRTVQRPDLLPPAQGIVQARAIIQSFAGKEVDVEISPSQPGIQQASGPIRTGRLDLLDGQGYLLYEAPERVHRIPFESTRSITRNDRGKSATVGLVVGAVLGAAVGAVLGDMASTLGCTDDSPRRCPSEAKPAAAGALVGALLMGAVGAGVGALVGHRTTFTF